MGRDDQDGRIVVSRSVSDARQSGSDLDHDIRALVNVSG